MSKRHVHVVPTDEGWGVRRENGDRLSSTHDTQKDAIDTGRETARREHVELVIHGRDGKIRDKDSFGNDPFPPRDRRH
jgi:hypothetical protein